MMVDSNEDNECCKDDVKVQVQVTPSPSTPLGVYFPAISSFLLLATGIIIEEFLTFPEFISIGLYVIAYLLVGWNVIRKSIRKLLKGDLFNEFFLMSIATFGAFYLGKYPEGVAVMLFYTVGELFQDHAVMKAKRSIQALLDVQSDLVFVISDGRTESKDPRNVAVGEVIQMKPGGRVGLDGELISPVGTFDTSALTGESMPRSMTKGDMVLAGMINLDTVTQVRVNRLFADTKLSTILHLVEEATKRKAKTQQFISKFARVYTPIVVGLALLIIFIPYLVVSDYVFDDYLYRSLIFLVISCPCALVISIPLGYFGGIGAASRHGILFKGSTFLDTLTKLDTIVFDKTGTLTKGDFEVSKIDSFDNGKDVLQQLAASLETHSSHPIANAICKQWKGALLVAEDISEKSGSGIQGKVGEDKVVVGKREYLVGTGIDVSNIPYDELVVGVGRIDECIGYFVLTDSIKEDTRETISSLQDQHLEVVMLSGDKQTNVDKIGEELGITTSLGELMPDEKLQYVENEKKSGKVVAFVGDGINDAPVIAAADVGMAMGGLGSDAAIESADVVIQTDQPGKILTAIRLAKSTKAVVWQNIGLAFGVKLIVMVLGAGGLATLWEAVFADVGVALLAILNASRILRM